MQKTITQINHPPKSPEFRSKHSELGYGVFLSAFLEKSLPIISTQDIFLTLQENNKFIVKANFKFLQQWVEQIIKQPFYVKLSQRRQSTYLSLLNKVVCKEVNFIQGILSGKVVEEEYESILNNFKKSVITSFAISVWDKDLKEFAANIEHYEVIDHPSAGIGNAKEYYSYKGQEIASYHTLLY